MDADFRVFYRIDGVGEEEWGTMTGPRFFSLAYRCGAYEGVMTARSAAQEEESRPAPRAATGGPKEVPATRAAIMADPVLRDLFD